MTGKVDGVNAVSLLLFLFLFFASFFSFLDMFFDLFSLWIFCSASTHPKRKVAYRKYLNHHF